MITTLLHTSISTLALFQSTQLNLFERFLSQAVSGIDSTSITAGMQNVGYVILLIGFLWQVYNSALHGGDVRGLATNLIKYVTTAIVIMNYHAVFTTINQGFVNAGNWISNASGVQNLFDNWQSDLQSQFSQNASQNMWGLITGSIAGFLDAVLILVAYMLYPIVILIFGFFYIFYGSVLYIFGPIVIALMPLGATNRLAKSYAENVFIWNAWPILYGGFGSLLSAVQMGQVGQMLSQNNFLGGLGNVEGSILIGLASIIYSLAIAVIPFIAKRIVSGEVGSTAAALVSAAGTALTTAIAAGEGVVAGVTAARASIASDGPTSGQGPSSTGPTSRTSTAAGGNQPAPQQRASGPSSSATTASGATNHAGDRQSGGLGHTHPTRESPATMGQEHAEQIRAAMGASRDTSEAGGTTSDQSAPLNASRVGEPAAGATNDSSMRARSSSSSSSGSRGSSSNRPTIGPHRLSTWGAYHIARFAAFSAVKGGHAAIGAVRGLTDAIRKPSEPAGEHASETGSPAGTSRERGRPDG